MAQSTDGAELLVVGPIPAELHVPDLRDFFEPAIERRLFTCFHFRRGGSASSCSTQRGGGKAERWCVVKSAGPQATSAIISAFHDVTWKEVLIDAALSLTAACEVYSYPGHFNKRVQAQISQDFNPPAGLMAGNVGTPRSDVLKGIAKCLIPASAVPRILGTPGLRRRTAWKSAAIRPPPCLRATSEVGDDHAVGVAGPQLARLKPNRVEVSAMTALHQAFKRSKIQRREVKEVEDHYLPRCLDDSDDAFDEPHEKVPHHQRNDRMESATGYLHEDEVEDIWDKHDASGLVLYTDAAYWDRLAGDLDERAHDGWDVERHSAEDAQVDAAARSATVLGTLLDAEDGELKTRTFQPAPAMCAASAGEDDDDTQELEVNLSPQQVTRAPTSNGESSDEEDPPLPMTKRRRKEVYGFDALRYGVAGKLMRRMGGSLCAQPSATFRAVVEGVVANRHRAGLGWEPPVTVMRKQTTPEDSTWAKIGSVFDGSAPADNTNSRGRPGSVRGAFHANPNSARNKRELPRVNFVRATARTDVR
mmetsp:Transcript_68855/g.128514  ORF Transcript_68855/g.128514 Transcript_68855/m.128514 type:complete len:533 (+) Transcript_68855:46-1644(+)